MAELRTSSRRPSSPISPRRSSGVARGRRGWPSAGWVGIDWPAEYGGRGATPVEVAVFNSEYARSRAPQLVNRVGSTWRDRRCWRTGSAGAARALAPADHDGRGDLVPALQRAGCGLGPRRALDASGPDGDGGWLVSGQKVWTSYAQFARWGLCLARSDPDSTGARGLTLFALDMKAPGSRDPAPRADDR